MQVLLGYGFVMYLWPLVVFYPHLRQKSRTYCFMFCTSVSVMFANTFVLGLGLLHVLQKSVVVLLYYGVFLWRLHGVWRLRLRGTEYIRKLRRRTITRQRLLYCAWEALRELLGKLWQRIRRALRGFWLEYALLAALLLFATVYFSLGALQVHAYGCGDEYVHHKWIYGLENGQIFSAGIYPEAMHCFVYLLSAVSGIPVFHVLLFLGGIHVHTLLLAVYIFSKSVFRWRWTPLLVLTLFLTIDSVDRDQVFTLSRLSWTLPMEFGFYGIFLCAYGLLRFLHRETPKGRWKIPWRQPKRWLALFRDEDLFIFLQSIAVTIAAHFYTTIMAVYVCLPIALVYCGRVLRKKNFVLLAVSVILAFLLAVVPMVLAFAEGIEPEASLYWAINVIKKSQNSLNEGEAAEDAAEDGALPPSAEPSPTAPAEEAAPSPVTTGGAGRRASPLELLRRIYWRNYQLLFPGSFARLLVLATAALAALSAALLCLRRLPGAGRLRPGPAAARYADYLAVAAASFFLVLMRVPSTLGIPSIMDGHRACVTIDVLAFMVFGSAADILFSSLRRVAAERWLERASVLCCAGIYLFAQLSGAFHGYLLFQMTRYPAAADLTEAIITRMPQRQYTIVSPTDELYHVIYTGYHEEVLDFLEQQAQARYTIPTPYVFVFIEKQPLYYVQYSFADGPLWLAKKKHPANFGTYAAQYPDILHGSVSEESARMAIRYGSQRSYVESNLSSRVVMESKLYAWYLEFTRLHPYAGSVVYEDEDFLCYCFTQNPFSLYTLSVLPEAYYRNIGLPAGAEPEEAAQEPPAAPDGPEGGK